MSTASRPREIDVISIARSPSGIKGLDGVLHGGFPAGRVTVAAGHAGSGKTVMALQYLVNGAELYGENSAFVTFEETEQGIRDVLASMAWPLEGRFDERFHVIDACIPPDTTGTGAFDLRGLIAVIESFVERHAIKRLALDGIDSLFAHANDDTVVRTELHRLLTWLEQTGLTTLLTVKRAENELSSRYDFLEYLAGSVVHLDYTFVDRALRRTFSVIKLRAGGYASGQHAFILDGDGIEIAYNQPILEAAPMRAERVSSGVERLDRMLGGGYRMGSTILISGLPGTGKSTLGGAFLTAGCEAGEAGLLVAHEESSEQLLFDLRSVGLDLERWHAAQTLTIVSLNTAAVSADEYFVTLRRLLDTHHPARLVLDSISALKKAWGPDIADGVCERLNILTKGRGITALFVARVDTAAGDIETTPMHVSTLADTWIHLAFALHGGERNRTLSIVKSRGTAHSNQLRELTFTGTEILLEDVYSASGEVLLGTARMERNQKDSEERSAARAALRSDLSIIDERSAELERQIESVRGILEGLDVRRAALVTRAEDITAEHESSREQVRAKRSADPDRMAPPA